MLFQHIYNIITFLPELFLISVLLYLIIWCVFLSTTVCLKTINYQLILLLIETFSITFILLLLNSSNVIRLLFFNTIIIDSFTTKIKLLLVVFTLIFLNFMLYDIGNIYDFEFPLLVSFSVFASLVLVSSFDLITFYLSIEMQSLCFYIIAAIKRQSRSSSEAGLKYFVLGACSSSLLLFGMSLIYGFLGSTNFDDISNILISLNLKDLKVFNSLILGLVLLLFGFFFKLTIVPFHIWGPDVYEGSPLIVTIFFSTIPKFAIFIVFLRLLFTVFFLFNFIWQPLLLVSSILTMLTATFAALYQKKIKRFFAYSSISHVGYMLIGLSTATLLGIHAFFLYLLVYILTLFFFGGVILNLKKQHSKTVIIYLTDFLYLQNSSNVLKILFVLILFSMAGIPPLLGFFSKFYLFFSAVEASFYLLPVVGLLSSILGSFYYIRFIKIVFFEKNHSINLQLNNVTSLVVNIFIILFLVFSLFLISPNFVFLESYKLCLCL